MSEEVYHRFADGLANATRRGRLTTHQIIVFLIIRYTMELRLGLVPSNARSVRNTTNRFRHLIQAENFTASQRNDIESRLDILNNFSNSRRRLNAPASPAHSST